MTACHFCSAAAAVWGARCWPVRFRWDDRLSARPVGPSSSPSGNSPEAKMQLTQEAFGTTRGRRDRHVVHLHQSARLRPQADGLRRHCRRDGGPGP